MGDWRPISQIFGDAGGGGIPVGVAYAWGQPGAGAGGGAAQLRAGKAKAPHFRRQMVKFPPRFVPGFSVLL